MVQLKTTGWRHQMEPFSALLAICAGNSPVPGEFPAQRPVTRSFDVFFDLRLNKRLNEQWWGWWFETPSPPLWRHRNEFITSRGHNGVGPCGSTSNLNWRAHVQMLNLNNYCYCRETDGMKEKNNTRCHAIFCIPCFTYGIAYSKNISAV